MKAPKSLIWSGRELGENLQSEIETLPTLTVGELREKFAELFGYRSESRNRTFLIRKCAWGIQAREFGDISEEARKRAHELADFRFLKRVPLKHIEVGIQEGRDRATKRLTLSRDQRLPVPGSILTRTYEGREVKVRVLEDGFEYQGRPYKSLSKIARDVTGSHWNGFVFFNLGYRA